MSDKSVGMKQPVNPAQIQTFTITRSDLGVEEVRACFVEFTERHIIFRGDNGHIEYGIHADRVIDIIQDPS